MAHTQVNASRVPHPDPCFTTDSLGKTVQSANEVEAAMNAEARSSLTTSQAADEPAAAMKAAS